ncbi:MAG: DNA ligase [Pontibacterium sp.]
MLFYIRIILLVLVGLPFTVQAGQPPLQLSGVYSRQPDLSRFWVSEKLDGVRGYWNGQQLLTRQGNVINAPLWFTAPLPEVALDGELWIARGMFDEVSGIVRRRQADEARWRQVNYMLFDLPGHKGAFTERLKTLESVVAEVNKSWVQLIPQQRITSEQALMSRLDKVVQGGGEGLMLHRGEALYHAARTHDLLKLKPWSDAEARVIAHLPGKGKYTGKLGALLVETPSGIRFKLGTGFSDTQRIRPPEIGTWVTYKYTGLTRNKVPRFASFLRPYLP